MSVTGEGLGLLLLVITLLLVASVCHDHTYNKTWGRIGDAQMEAKK